MEILEVRRDPFRPMYGFFEALPVKVKRQEFDRIRKNGKKKAGAVSLSSKHRLKTKKMVHP